jgi:hypothetical protein
MHTVVLDSPWRVRLYRIVCPHHVEVPHSLDQLVHGSVVVVVFVDDHRTKVGDLHDRTKIMRGAVTVILQPIHKEDRIASLAELGLELRVVAKLRKIEKFALRPPLRAYGDERQRTRGKNLRSPGKYTAPASA